MNEVSNLFVCLMGMGTTFVGLICIIFLTMLMGKVMQKLEKPEDIANMEKRRRRSPPRPLFLRTA